ncbi:hypothetical protein DMN91_005983 [Ooceraea biroi]|uniref:Uncharacterized protein n=1 Tax=Ooceraea biroi TaxID=2015173 RepID=A0A3L8DMG5_OOCBI|nr:cold and drought-regulated protein CORA [Ooceraea biroi]RLU21610.1 hypothetical protein DMN91_005983 [Ooceraea biroi]
MKKSVSLIIALCAIFLNQSHGKPTEIAKNADVLDPAASTANNNSSEAVVETVREQRSPQFGLFDNYGDYSDYGDNARFYYGSKRKYHHHKPYHHKPIGGHGCRGYGCGGGLQPDYGGHYYGGQGSSFASASAGSIGGGGPYNGGHSGANAQSASFSVGPFSASFSSAQASGNSGF